MKSVSIEIWSPDLWRYFLEVFDLFVEKFSFASQEEIFNNILKTSILAWGKGTLFGKPEKVRISPIFNGIG